MPFISTANARMPLDLAVDSFPAPGLTSQGVVLVKNRRGRGLKEFVAALPPGRGGTRFLVEELIEKKWIDPDVLAPGWTGLVVLRCGFQVLAGGLGNLFAKFLAEPMQYIAVTAQEPGEAREFPEVYGTFRYESPAASRPPADPAADDRDVEWDLELLDVRFRAREIVSLQLNGTLTIFKLFRADPEAGAQPSTFEITGRYQGKDDADNPTRRARVLLEGAPKNPLRVDVNVGPVKAGRLDRVRVSVEGVDPDAPTGSGGRFEIDGAIELDPAWRLGPIGIGADANGKSEVPIRRLGLSLGTTPRMSWDWPALEFPLAQREPVRLGPLTFRFERFGFSVPDATTHRHTLLDDTLRVAGNGDITAARCPFAVARVELFKYPEFGPKAGQTLGFDLVAALDHDGTAPKIGVKGIDFKNLDIDLFRLVRLRAKSISVDQVPNGTRQYIEVREMKLDFLEKPLIENLTVALLQDGPERGFAAYLEQDIDLGLLTIRWVLVSYHLRLAKSARLLLSLEDVGPETDVRDAIVADVKGAGPLTAGGPGWGFGIGCELLGGGIACKLLYVDGGSSGLMVKSPLLEDAIGFGGLAVGYLKGERPEDDRYWTEFPVPMMDFGPVAFLGGVIGLEYLVRGGFTFDAGFPWLRDGLRRWDRGFGVNYGIFVGHAGFYVKYHPGTAPTDDGTTKTLTLAAGFGIAVGYGYCDTYLGVFTVYLSVEVYAIVEGALVLALPGGTPEPRSASLAGIVGLVARGVGKLDVWVLSAEFEVLVFGETESRVDWQPGRPTHVTYTIRQGYHISASCRIGRGILSWTYHYDANMTFELSGSIAL